MQKYCWDFMWSTVYSLGSNTEGRYIIVLKVLVQGLGLWGGGEEGAA